METEDPASARREADEREDESLGLIDGGGERGSTGSELAGLGDGRCTVEAKGVRLSAVSSQRSKVTSAD